MTAALVIMNIVFIILCYATASKIRICYEHTGFCSEFDPVCSAEHPDDLLCVCGYSAAV
mgnify:CR=1 FL=1